MSEGHEAGSTLSISPTAAASLSDSVRVNRRIVLALNDSLGAVDTVANLHRLPLVDSVHAADSVVVDYIANYRPTTYSDTGRDQNGNPSPCLNDGNAIDGNPSSDTLCLGTYSPGAGGGPVYAQKEVTYFAFPAKQGSPATITLNVISSSSANVKCTSYSLGMQYSLNAGSSWTGVPGQSGVYGANTATIPLSSSQDFTQVQVRGTAECFSAPSPAGDATLNINEIWIFAE